MNADEIVPFTVKGPVIVLNGFLLPGDRVCNLSGLPRDSDHRQILISNTIVWGSRRQRGGYLDLQIRPADVRLLNRQSKWRDGISFPVTRYSTSTKYAPKRI